MSAYTFRVLIDTDRSEEIFRDVKISAHDNFETFYQAIIMSFDFSGDQLASFYVSNDNWDKGHEIALMDMGLGNDLNAPFIMKDTPISTVMRTKGQKLILVYDFLRMWCFLIELIEITEDEMTDPFLILSVGNAPLETDREVNLEGGFDMGIGVPDLGNDIDDIFSEFNEDEDNELGDFENIDDLDI